MQEAEVGLCLEGFSVSLISLLAKTLEEVVGLDDAEGFISVVGVRTGNEIDSAYKQGLSIDRLDRRQVAAVLVDLKNRIKGEFLIIEESDSKIVLRNKRCPFGDKVIGRESLCMMTTNVFGTIAARNLGYARVDIEKAIARGDDHCSVVVHLKPSAEGTAQQSREFYREGHGAP
jgi:predicted ArsR family transcriptional regulator